ncbi:MAG: nucleotidyltransferase domain-containing protein [Deltaproteobacteria bacterium]|nr:nucleotidyltransferase domain-containing protein [Deltaproteobacteria bacterium]
MGRDAILSILRDFKQNYAEEYGILEIGIFGSAARDEIRDDSDVDICIKTKTPNPFTLVHIKENIESLMQKHVDIVRIREKMNPFLKERIEKEGVYV